MKMNIFHPVNVQHYVPRHYLSAWARRIVKKKKKIDLVACRIKDELKNNIDTMTIGQEEHFYAYPQLTFEQLREIIGHIQSRPGIDRLLISHIYKQALFIPLYIRCLRGERNEDLLQQVDVLVNSGILDAVHSSFLIDASSMVLEGEFKKEAELAARDTEIVRLNGFEAWMTYLEGNFNPLLDRARNGDLSFMNEPQDRISFIHSVFNQMLRTCKYDYLVKAGKGALAAVDPALICFLRHEAAFEVAKNFSISHRDYELKLIENSTDMEFITGDQPLCNLISDANAGQFDLYYPVSPRKALIFVKKGRYENVYRHLNELSVREVDELNRKICEVSVNQLYASTSYVLELGHYYASKWAPDKTRRI